MITETDTKLSMAHEEIQDQTKETFTEFYA